MNAELEIGGVYFPTLLASVALAAIPFLILRAVLLQVGLYRWIWHRALFDIAVYVVFVALIDRNYSFLFHQVFP